MGQKLVKDRVVCRRHLVSHPFVFGRLVIFTKPSIMPPGTWHAVYTPDDCVCAGGHFLLASTMDQTLATLGLLDCYPDLTNEDVPENMFDMLGKFIRQVIAGTRSLTALQVDSFRLALLDYITVGQRKRFLILTTSICADEPSLYGHVREVTGFSCWERKPMSYIQALYLELKQLRGGWRREIG